MLVTVRMAAGLPHSVRPIRLPLRGPVLQRSPIDTLVRLAKPVNTACFHILDFHRQIGATHQSLSKEINAMPDMRR